MHTVAKFQSPQGEDSRSAAISPVTRVTVGNVY
jgi:hypothetical protein